MGADQGADGGGVRKATPVMCQSRASMEEDLPEAADAPTGATFLFVEVEDLDRVEAALEGSSPWSRADRPSTAPTS
ncbi:MAG: hypothetical protein Q8W44_00855 [Candidatus Palauibacterales bacterium]|nr:hypothetical protein [Candidatus Palauibacterales bacterium]